MCANISTKGKKPSILLVARGFPPYIKSLGGAVRILKLAEYLTDRGFETQVLAGSGYNYGDFGYSSVLKKINVSYVDDPVLRAQSPADNGLHYENAYVSWRERAKQLVKPLFLDFSIPDSGIYAVPRLVRAACALVTRHEITSVVTSGPPHSDHLVGLWLKRQNPSLRWIVDYRDSWNGTSLFRKRNALAQRLNIALERAVLKAADQIIVISEPMIEKLAAVGGDEALRAKTSLVLNGFDKDLAPTEAGWRNDYGPLRIGYFGSLDDRPSSYRNPAVLFEAALRVGQDVVFDLYGPVGVNPVWQRRLGDSLQLHGNLDHSEAVRKMAAQDALILLHTKSEGADEVITGKVFEYISSGRPIISVGPSDMAVNSVLRDDVLSYAVENSLEGLVDLLHMLIRQKREDRLGSRGFEIAAQFSRDKQYAKLLALL